MKRIGSILVLLALCLAIAGLSLRHLGFEEWARIVAMVFFVALLSGAVLLVIAAIIDLKTGQTRIRPVAALLAAPLLFAAAFALRLLFEALSGEPEYDWPGMLLFSAVFATVYSLHSTAYRRTV